MTDYSISLEKLFRKVKIYGDKPIHLFLGSGASISSEVPSAKQCIWKWKKEIFLSHNPELKREVKEISLPSVKNRIQNWLDDQGRYPVRGAESEYSFYANEIAGSQKDTSYYFKDLIKGKEPSIGYELISYLAEDGLVETVWTTNFDSLCSKAAIKNNVECYEIDLDNSENVRLRISQDELKQVALHGDYRYNKLKNTREEIRQQNEKFQTALKEELKYKTLIVLGYSGRDDSIMQTLHEAYSESGEGRLFWGVYGGTKRNVVEDLIKHARENGREAHVFAHDGFDDVITRLSKYYFEEDKYEKIIEKTNRLEDSYEPEPFTINFEKPTNALKSNAFEVKCPTTIFRLDVDGFDTSGAWARLKNQIQNEQITAGLFETDVLAFGTLGDLKRVFQINSDDSIEKVSLEEFGRFGKNKVIKQILRDTIVRAIADKHNLKFKKSHLWDPNQCDTKIIKHEKCFIYQSLDISMRHFANKDYLILQPSIYVKTEVEDEKARGVVKLAKVKELRSQWNKKYNQSLNSWREILFDTNSTFNSFQFPSNSDSPTLFEVRSNPLFAKVFDPKRRDLDIEKNNNTFLKQIGKRFPEPKLIFNSYKVDNPQNVHPLKGLVENRPVDFPLIETGLRDEIGLSVITPAKHSEVVAEFLNRFKSSRKAKVMTEYLIDYPGFGQIFNLPLNIPDKSGPRWLEIEHLDLSSKNRKKIAKTLKKDLIKKTDRLINRSDPRLILYFIPEKWSKYTKINTDDFSFDLHDEVKGYCVSRGVPSQFLRERTLNQKNICEILWSLSIAFYVKNNGTPWNLEKLDQNTAYAGIGFSSKNSSEKDEPIILGTSHLYNSEGIGLGYRLSVLSESYSRQGNPFLSKNDARKVAFQIKELYFDSRNNLPDRVVVHKNTPFIKKEIKGLREGFEGVDRLDLLELKKTRNLKYIASEKTKQGNLQESGFPVKRSTCLKLDDYRVLLWVHGSVDIKNNSRNPYYQGKSRIPSPLIMKRHFGATDLSTLAQEVLGFSKMNWNSSSLYSQLPSTIVSAKRISRMVRYLGKLDTDSFDYRLFI